MAIDEVMQKVEMMMTLFAIFTNIDFEAGIHLDPHPFIHTSVHPYIDMHNNHCYNPTVKSVIMCGRTAPQAAVLAVRR